MGETRKTVLFIVEGPSDKSALEKIFKKIYRYADAFYEKFIGNEDKFIGFLQTDVVNGVPDNFIASWRYIKEDLHSVERHTNLNLYFINHPRPSGLL